MRIGIKIYKRDYGYYIASSDRVGSSDHHTYTIEDLSKKVLLFLSEPNPNASCDCPNSIKVELVQVWFRNKPYRFAPYMDKVLNYPSKVKPCFYFSLINSIADEICNHLEGGE